MTCIRPSRSLQLFFLALCWAAARGTGATEPQPVMLGDDTRHCLRSAHFMLHTDLSSERGQQLLESMEKTLAHTESYWRRPVEDLIECYVVDNLDHWPEGELPHPMARLVIERIGGVTLIDKEGVGIEARNKVTILGSSRPGVAEHEVVHAYCGMVFGVTGPAWYREGIAQVFAYAQGEGDGMRCPPELIADLTGENRKPLLNVVKRSEFSKRLVGSLNRKMSKQQSVAGLAPITNWNQRDIETLDKLKQNYAWSWLTCHLLFHNPNYQARFRSLGNSYLADQEDGFQSTLGPVFDQLAFEYDFTVEHFVPGYRVDLCHWDWDKRFRCIRGGHPIRVRIDAARGYQASGLAIAAGHRYRVMARGTWQVDAHGTMTDADGDVRGRGRLEGIVMWQYKLSEPLDLGADGEFEAPSDGLLYLRCRDDWAQLADNNGNILVSLNTAK